MDTMTPSAKKPKSHALSAVMIVGLLALVVVIDIKRRGAENQLAQVTMRLEQVTGGNTAQNLEAAKAIIAKVSKLYKIPSDVEPTVATIVDVDKLRTENDFYKNAENNDVLVVWPEKAILYRESENKIIDVVAVSIQAPAAGAEGTPSSAGASSVRVQAQQ